MIVDWFARTEQFRMEGVTILSCDYSRLRLVRVQTPTEIVTMRIGAYQSEDLAEPLMNLIGRKVTLIVKPIPWTIGDRSGTSLFIKKIEEGP